MISRHYPNTIAIGLLASSFLVLAANYGALNHQQAEKSNKRASYLDVLNLLKKTRFLLY